MIAASSPLRRFGIAAAATCLLAFGIGRSAQAQVTLNATNFGIYETFGNPAFFSQTPDAYRTGQFVDKATDPFPPTARAYFVFDVPVLGFTVTSATLRVMNSGGGETPDGTETYAIFDVTTPINDLITGGGSLGTTYNDLGTGTEFGSTAINPAALAQGDIVLFNLVALVPVVNASGPGQLALGGAITTLGNNVETIFGTSNPNFQQVQLVLEGTVSNVAAPEPGTLALLGAIALPVALQVIRRRRR